MDGEQCPVCTGTAAVVVAVAHHTLRQLIIELLRHDHATWEVTAVPHQSDLADAIAAAAPELVILDVGDFARSCRESLQAFPRQRVIVIGPEPDAAYEHAARQGGAGAWLTRDRLGQDLVAAMRSALGCAPVPTLTPQTLPRSAEPPPERTEMTRQSPPRTSSRSPEDLSDQRLAAGHIGVEEYRTRRTELEHRG